MANDEHLKILKQGVEAWNVWRKEHPEIKPVLRTNNFRVEIPLPADQIFVEGANLEGDYPSRTTYRKPAYFPGVDFSFTDLEEVNLEGANLEGANFRGANLTGAHLKGANLKGARLTKANLTRADLKEANLEQARLEQARLERANLRGANFRGANLAGAYLREALLEDTDLSEANLEDANLSTLAGARLDRALLKTELENVDLRRTRGLKLDGHYIRGAKFSPRAQDPWSVLRRNYTGPMLHFHLLLLALFALPYGARTMMWLGVNRAQAILLDTTAELEAATVALEASQDPNAESIRRITGQLSQLQPCLEADCETYEVWELLIGIDKGWKYWTLALTLILYNLGRGFLTWTVGPIRDEEERSGYAPMLRSYQRFYWIHRVVAILLFVALFAFLFNAWHWLRTPVWLPT